MTQKPVAWAVTACSRMFMGEFAEFDAKAEALRCGGTCVAYELYAAPVVAQQAEQAGWIDASKQMPPAQVRVLGFEPQYNIIDVDMWFGPDFQWGYSYWMPLPAAPRGGV